MSSPKNIIIILLLCLYLIGCSDDIIIDYFPDSRIDVENILIVSGENNKTVDHSLFATFGTPSHLFSDVDSAFINKKILKRVKKAEYKLVDNEASEGNIEFEVFNYEGYDFNVTLEQIEPIRITNMSSGDTISKSNLPIIQFNKVENSWYKCEIQEEINTKDIIKSVDDYYYGKRINDTLNLNNFSIDTLKSNDYYLVIVGSNGRYYPVYENEIEIGEVNFQSFYTYYIKFYLTD